MCQYSTCNNVDETGKAMLATLPLTCVKNLFVTNLQELPVQHLDLQQDCRCVMQPYLWVTQLLAATTDTCPAPLCLSAHMHNLVVLHVQCCPQSTVIMGHLLRLT